MRRQFLSHWLGAILFAAAVAPGAARAQGSYPDHAVRIIVPYTPGGFNDAMARLFGKRLQEAFGQPFIVDNKPGGGTIVGTDLASKSPADGYTLLIQGFPLIVNQHLYAKLPYYSRNAFMPVILGGETPNVLLVRADSPFKTMKQLIDAAKAKPGQINYASAGNGTSLHLAMEYFKSVTGTDMNHIPYKGSAPMVNDLLCGQVDVMFDNLPNALPQVKAGKMRALAVSVPKRLSELPDIPTVAEQGYPGFDVTVWYGLFAPAGTPAAIVAKLNAELAKAMKTDAMKASFRAQGVEPIGGSVEDYQKFNRAQDEKWGAVIRKSGIKAD
ncbi:MAG: tripartite tricarboxylate transporter substrate binding protein [Candidatus Protistobacter heckmanni]|nr:tripartite tricarboxylate transporter substrate binding protein [Candidatus Protistobacter heckmanni]